MMTCAAAKLQRKMIGENGAGSNDDDAVSDEDAVAIVVLQFFFVDESDVFADLGVLIDDDFF
jgi:hypothetical protein